MKKIPTNKQAVSCTEFYASRRKINDIKEGIKLKILTQKMQ